ncbi:MAG: hypothetical protein P4L84_33895 [Isosphaeraceae bacterium]|nr:hypothetical protein [Isosphaeraceae bacterium]
MMLTRRTFLGGIGACLAGLPSVRAAGPRKKLAVVTTLWNYHSHAWHMAERFLAGYPIHGAWHRPDLEVVSAYVDQKPEGDLSRDRAREFGFTIYPTIAEALRCGGDKLAVDAVLIIGEHGDYPVNAIGQKQYPRYQFFQQITDVFRKDGRTTPVFSDKHLSWKWEWAKEMVETSRAMGFPFLAGSSLPVTWRMPSVDLPLGAEAEEVLGIAFGPVDIYDFHALEMIQCMAERRRGGETGVAAVQGLRGDSVWKALDAGSWKSGGWDPRLFEACLARSQTLAQTKDASHRYPTREQMREWVKQPVAYRIEYADGLKATMLQLNGLVQDFTFAARLKGAPEPLSTLFYLPSNPNVVYSAALMSKAESLFLTGKPAYPVERTLLTSGLVAACLQSLASSQTRLETPHLAVRYTPSERSTFWQD